MGRVRPVASKFLRFSLEVFKIVLIGSIVFIGIPYIYELTSIYERLNANIYDFYGVIILAYLVYRIHILEGLVDRLNKPERVYYSVENKETLDDEEWFKIS